MRKTLLIKIAVGLALAGGAALQGCWWRRASFSGSLRGQLESETLKGFELTGQNQDGEVQSFAFKRASELLTVSSSPADGRSAAKYARDKEYLIDSLYREYPSPYPGLISHTLRCTAEFLPKKERVEDGDVHKLLFELYANDRRTFGGCGREERKYRAIYLIINCPKTGRVFDVKYFTDPDDIRLEAKEFLTGVNCAR